MSLLGDPTRRAIFELLARRPWSVQELADQLPISRPAVSQHLKVLRDGGLVVSQPVGTRRIYRLNPAEPLPMAIAGRPTTDELSGPGTPTPPARITG